MRTRLRAALLLLLLAGLLLEAMALVQPLLISTLHRSYPNVAMDDEGRVIYFDTHRDDGRAVDEIDATRTAPHLGLSPVRVVFTSALAVFPAPSHFDNPLFLTRYFAREWRPHPPPLEAVAQNVLQPMEADRRGLRATHGQPDGIVAYVFALEPHGQRAVAMPVEWRVEDGRLVCRETATGRTLAGLGPDGCATGDHALEGQRFGRIDAGPIVTRPGREDAFEWLLLDTGQQRLHVMSVPKAQAKATDVPVDSTDIATVSVETRPLHPLAGGAETETMPFTAIVGQRALVFLADGSVVADIAMEPLEHVSGTNGSLLVYSENFEGYFFPPSKPKLGTVVVETAFVLGHPDKEHRRLRLFRTGQPEVVRDVVLTPTRPSEVFLANLNAALALLRPPPLAIASALSPLPQERWWWRDPWLAGGSYIGWLLASLALAGFLAFRARRKARERCASLREVRFWTIAVLLLGPVGLLWMRFVLPRVPVESVGNARRAVNLDASPSASAPWPDPKPEGIEVFS